MPRRKGPLFDFSDDQLHQMLTDGAGMDLPPPLGDIVDLLMESSLRFREIRRYCIHHAEEHGGTMWVKAERVMQMLEGT